MQTFVLTLKLAPDDCVPDLSAAEVYSEIADLLDDCLYGKVEILDCEAQERNT